MTTLEDVGEQIAKAYTNQATGQDIDWTALARAALTTLKQPDINDAHLAADMAGNELSWDCNAQGVAQVRAKMIDAILGEHDAVA